MEVLFLPLHLLFFHAMVRRWKARQETVGCNAVTFGPASETPDLRLSWTWRGTEQAERLCSFGKLTLEGGHFFQSYPFYLPFWWKREFNCRVRREGKTLQWTTVGKGWGA